jgi:hypothetical protein
MSQVELRQGIPFDRSPKVPSGCLGQIPDSVGPSFVEKSEVILALSRNS